MLNRAILIVLDSVGVGNAPDAAAYGDEGANTVGHIAQRTTLNLPHMNRLGFAHIPGTNLTRDPAAAGAYGCMTEASSGKDTTTGHWEIAGLKLEKPFPTYPHGFPAEVMDAFSAAIGRGWLMDELERGVTALSGKGMYSGTEKQVLLCVVNRFETMQLRRIVFSIDPSAFVIANKAHEVLGEGFKQLP